MTTINVIANPITTTVTSPTVTAATTNVTIDVVTSGYGEEAIPNDGLFKRLADTASTSEVVNVSQGFSRSLTDILTISELATLVQNLNRGTADFSSMSDAFSRVFSANRDVLEVSIVADTKSMAVSKPFPLEVQIVSDASFLSPNKVATELTTASDTKLFNIAPSIFETPITSETITLLSSFTRLFNEPVPVTELFQPVVQYIRTISDMVVATELSLIGQSFGDTESSTASTSDSTTKGIQPRFSDIPLLTEVIALLNTFNRSFSDTAVSTDSPSLGVSMKPGTDTAVASDVSTRSIGGKYTDSSTVTDGGVINNQSYYAGNYVVPGYVGTNYSF